VTGARDEAERGEAVVEPLAPHDTRDPTGYLDSYLDSSVKSGSE
jgi:hypothetical protein